MRRETNRAAEGGPYNRRREGEVATRRSWRSTHENEGGPQRTALVYFTTGSSDLEEPLKGTTP